MDEPISEAKARGSAIAWAATSDGMAVARTSKTDCCKLGLHGLMVSDCDFFQDMYGVWNACDNTEHCATYSIGV